MNTHEAWEYGDPSETAHAVQASAVFPRAQTVAMPKSKIQDAASGSD